jgi:hypothetical protein
MARVAIAELDGASSRGSNRGVWLSLVVGTIAVLAVVGPATATIPPQLPQTGLTADLGVAPNPAHPGENVTLDARNSTAPNGSIEACEFDVDGDGNDDRTETDCVLGRPYDTLGEYDVRVRVRTTDGRTATDTVTLEVVANQPPTARIVLDPATAEPGESVTLSAADSTDSDGTIRAYRWSLPDRTTTGDRITASWTEPGTYPVSLAVEDDDGATEEATATVEVVANEPPVARLSASRSTAAVGGVVDLDTSESTDPDGTIAAYAWDFDGDGRTDRTTESPRTTFRPEASGDRAVGVTVIDDEGATATASVDLAVEPAPAEPTPSEPPTTEAATSTPGPTDARTATPAGSVLGVPSLGFDLLGMLAVLLLLVAGGVGLTVARRRDLLAEGLDRLQELLTRGDVRRRLGRKASGTTVKTAAKQVIKRVSDLIDAGGDALGEAVERVGRAIKRGSSRLAAWLRQFGA